MASKLNLPRLSIHIYSAGRDIELRLIFDASLKMIHYLPVQRLINPWLHRPFHPNIELSIPSTMSGNIHN